MGMKIVIEIVLRKIVELEDTVTLVKEHCKLDIRKFSERTINE